MFFLEHLGNIFEIFLLFQHGNESAPNSENAHIGRSESTEETAGASDEERPTLTLKETISSILSFLMAQSYIASLIIMMVGINHQHNKHTSHQASLR